MSEIIDLNAKRNEREQPDAEHVRHDDFGRPLYEFLLDYEFDGSHWSASVWAYDEAEAQKRVESMRHSLRYMGQMFTVIPA
jgi:hypothetical protein